MILCGKSDVGRRRNENQDCFRTAHYEGLGELAVVCDGMGGNRGGREASTLAADAFLMAVDSYPVTGVSPQEAREKIPVILREAAETANEAICSKVRREPSLRGMGTTLVATFVTPEWFVSVNVGDSRLYYVTGGEARQITHDHSLVQYMVDLGRMTPEQAATSANKNIITRAIGIDAVVEPDVTVTEIGPEERGVLLLCSDGLSNMVDGATLAAVLALPEDGATEEWLADRGNELIALANEAGGPDNITAVLAAL